jgi:uncharacterized protein involved in exopolysaccharide biosynthesis
VQLGVTMRDPELAAAVANRMVELVNEYNLRRRQSSSREQRRFLAARVDEAQRELRAAEDVQSAFLLRNRRFVGSPLLSEQAARLERDVRMKQEVFITLSKSLEEARVAEVRDTPMLTIVDHATPPDRATNPRPALWAGIAAALGLLSASAMILAAAARQTRRTAAAELDLPRRSFLPEVAAGTRESRAGP